MAPRPKAAALPASGKKNMKQGNLFSFFGKKAKPTVAKTVVTQPTQTQPSPKPTPPSNTADVPLPSTISPATQALLDQVTVRCRIEIYWAEDKEWYSATVTKRRDDSASSQPPQPHSYFVHYDVDGQSEWIDLASEPFRFIVTTKKKAKKRIIESDDEEAEFDMPESDDDGDDDGSEYLGDGNNDDDDDDDSQLMVTDDDDDADIIKSKPAKKQKTGIATTSTSSVVKKRSTGSTNTSALQRFSAPPSVRVTQHPSAKTPTGRPSAAQQIITPASSTNLGTYSQTSPLAHHQGSTPPQQPLKKGKAPAFEMGVVNPAGSHVHNHLAFLTTPRDKSGRPVDHPQYDGRTLKIHQADWIKVAGKKMTDAVQQWWELKSQYYDSVLLFKTGKFYEMFHMDADVGVQICGLTYMKGHVAHAGFPEISYGTMADKLVRAGYKVARVEQTETPDQLKERKKKCSRGSAPKVVNREVCSILTIGTRTFCFLDEPTGKFVDEAAADTSIGPLLVIREIECEPSASTSDPDAVQPHCEYGITLVDAVRGSVTLGEFADDILRSRMVTLLTTFCPSEILLEGGENGASPTLVGLIKSVQTTSQQDGRLEFIQPSESFPLSTALDPQVRKQLERGNNQVQPWDVNQTLQELHRRKYYPCASKKESATPSVHRWPKVLRAAVEGEANLALSSLGAALYYLQRNLIDMELLSMGIVKAYIPPESSATTEVVIPAISQLAEQQCLEEAGLDEQSNPSSGNKQDTSQATHLQVDQIHTSLDSETTISHMSLDGTTLHNLEILTNSVNHKVAGSLWSKINFTKTPHGSRLLRAWLLRPLFRKEDIERRADVVEELSSGSAAMALSEARSILSKCGDIERLLSRVHSMSGCSMPGGDEDDERIHPNDRAVLYENASYNKRKVGDFSKVLNGLRSASHIPELFQGISIESGLLRKIVFFAEDGGCFPDIAEDLDFFFNNFDCNAAAKGTFEPSRGVDDLYDQACDCVEATIAELMNYKDEMCSNVLRPRSLAKSSWKYANTNPDSKDKYLIELPANVIVPDDFIMKGKRGSGPKQINKYRSYEVEQQVKKLEIAFCAQKERKARGMELIFAKFDSKRTLWAAAAQATALLDALGSLAQTANKAGYTRPQIASCTSADSPKIQVTQGRHPCVEHTFGSSEFIPNDLSLGCRTLEGTNPRVLLLSGPNMGGKSTLLRQTCLITILAQIGSFVPAVECEVTPVDRIFTRLGASDRILLNQSTFFVELAETAAALRGATRRSLVIMDELGRGTSTFDGTAIASATVQHLVERSKCLSLFATHYHSLLDEWKSEKDVQLGHMQCLVQSTDSEDAIESNNITFLYTLGPGVCPKSFGINVARLAGLPKDVLHKAARISSDFESEMTSTSKAHPTVRQKEIVEASMVRGDWNDVLKIWTEMQS